MSEERNLLRNLNKIKKLAGDYLAELSAMGSAPKKRITRVTTVRPDFTLNERKFIKTYARDMSGPKKFVLLLAYLAKGQVGSEVKVADIKVRWNKMTTKNLMDSSFNRKYPNEARSQGWIDSVKHGHYQLEEAWQDIFS